MSRGTKQTEDGGGTRTPSPMDTENSVPVEDMESDRSSPRRTPVRKRKKKTGAQDEDPATPVKRKRHTASSHETALTGHKSPFWDSLSPIHRGMHHGSSPKTPMVTAAHYTARSPHYTAGPSPHVLLGNSLKGQSGGTHPFGVSISPLCHALGFSPVVRRTTSGRLGLAWTNYASNQPSLVVAGHNSHYNTRNHTLTSSSGATNSSSSSSSSSSSGSNSNSNNARSSSSRSASSGRGHSYHPASAPHHIFSKASIMVSGNSGGDTIASEPFGPARSTVDALRDASSTADIGVFETSDSRREGRLNPQQEYSLTIGGNRKKSANVNKDWVKIRGSKKGNRPRFVGRLDFKDGDNGSSSSSHHHHQQQNQDPQESMLTAQSHDASATDFDTFRSDSPDSSYALPYAGDSPNRLHTVFTSPRTQKKTSNMAFTGSPMPFESRSHHNLRNTRIPESPSLQLKPAQMNGGGPAHNHAEHKMGGRSKTREKSTPASMRSSKRAASAGDAASKPCNCKKSKCLKLYCECFARQAYCNSCNCQGCNNTPKFEHLRQKAIAQTIERDANAFFRGKHGDKKVGDKQARKGCCCKKSECLKKYCECYQAGMSCTESCKCLVCKNGKPGRMSTNIAATAQQDRNLTADA